MTDWDTWPFDGDLWPRPLAPLSPEPPLSGAGGVNCRACTAGDADYIWVDDRWRLMAFPPSGLPLVLILEPRDHFAGPGDLPIELAREQGELLGRVERAVASIPGVARVHLGRWGEGGEHLHWWIMARPEGFGQLRSSFAAIWDDVLPVTPDEVWSRNVRHVVGSLRAAPD